MEDDREKWNLDKDEDVDVEAHKAEPTEGEKRDADEGDDVEAHKH